MSREEYIKEVQAVLDAHSEQAASRLSAALKSVPPSAKAVTVDVFVDQDGEGFLDIRVGLNGPDLVPLNRAISQHSKLFETRMTGDGLVPALPLMDASGEDFSVQDALTDCAASWLSAVWAAADHRGFHLPVTIRSPGGYGTTTPIQLHA